MFKELGKLCKYISDANKAAEMLGKYYALFTDKLNVDGDMDFNIQVDYGDDGNE